MERKLKSRVKVFLSTAVIGLLLTYFNNCSVLPSDHGTSLFSLDACASEMYTIFTEKMHPMLMNQCSTCHVPSGQGKGAFAHRDVDIAFESFYSIGIDKVSEYAVDAGHNAPYTGSQNEDIVNESLDDWSVIKPICQLEDGAKYFSQSVSLSTAPTGGSLEYTLTFDFNGSVVRIDIEKVTVNNQTTYRLSDPEVTPGSSNIHIRGMVFYLNGEYQNLARTFSGIDQTLSAGVPEQFSGIEIITAVNPATDTFQVGFISVEIVE